MAPIVADPNMIGEWQLALERSGGSPASAWIGLGRIYWGDFPGF